MLSKLHARVKTDHRAGDDIRAVPSARATARPTLRRMEHVDVLIVGGGAAGCAAALAAASAGARTVLLRHTGGATALARGGWSGTAPDGVAGALAAAGLRLEAVRGRLPHPDGRLIPYGSAPSSHARAALGPDGGRTMVCGIAGLAGFRPRALTALWSHAAGLDGSALVPVALTLPATPAAGWSPVSLAACIQREPALLGRALADAARRHGADRAIVPAVVGLESHEVTLESVTEAAAVVVGEALGTAPSIPGWRLDRALVAAVRAAGAGVVHARVTGSTSEDGKVRLDALRQDGTALSVSASAVILATGRYIGGGVAADPDFTIGALGIPLSVRHVARSFTGADESLALTDPVRLEPQAILGVGVATDPDGMIVADGQAQAGIFAAGSVRAGVQTAALGLGDAAADGWQAGAAAAARALAGTA
jgi:glycerol-3-phosphate dehydrogenase subunit B